MCLIYMRLEIFEFCRTPSEHLFRIYVQTSKPLHGTSVLSISLSRITPRYLNIPFAYLVCRLNTPKRVVIRVRQMPTYSVRASNVVVVSCTEFSRAENFCFAHNGGTFEMVRNANTRETTTKAWRRPTTATPTTSDHRRRRHHHRQQGPQRRWLNYVQAFITTNEGARRWLHDCEV